jgi:hypothetical protein
MLCTEKVEIETRRKSWFHLDSDQDKEDFDQNFFQHLTACWLTFGDPAVDKTSIHEKQRLAIFKAYL